MTFLATTGLSEFWDPTDELLFLGSWCLRGDGSDGLEGRDYQTLPSPWNDPAEFERAVAYLSGSYERILARLSDYLNAALGVDHGARYWRIVIGPWLLEYLHPFYDRYRRLIAAQNQLENLNTIVMSSDSWIVPRDTVDVADLVSNDPYNLQLCSQILKSLGFDASERRYKGSWLGGNERSSIRTAAFAASRLTWELVLRANRRLFKHRMRAALLQVFTSPSVLGQLAATSRLRVCPVSVGELQAAREPVFDHRRLGLGSLARTDEFEDVFVQSLPNALPALYLEGFRDISETAGSVASELPNVFASSSWIYHEPVKFVAGAALERGARLLATQHGGGYGLLHNFPFEKHERTIVDRYYTWGWASEGNSKTANLPSLKLVSRSPRDTVPPKRATDGQSGRVLLVGTSHHQYLFRFHSAPVEGQWQEYLKDQATFLHAVSPDIRDHVHVRLGQPDYADAAAFLRREVPGIRFDESRTLHAALKLSSLVVVDNPMTAFLESLHLNIPTLLFWDATRWVARAEAEPFLDQLRYAGILQPSAAEAAQKLAEVRADLAAWWGIGDVQRARHLFVQRFALSTKQWRRIWCRALDEEASSAAGPAVW